MLQWALISTGLRLWRFKYAYPENLDGQSQREPGVAIHPWALISTSIPAIVLRFSAVRLIAGYFPRQEVSVQAPRCNTPADRSYSSPPWAT
jgi:hypothetical protein